MLVREERVPGVRTIAIVRANALGDLIVALPALEAVRAAYPEAEIVLLGKELHRELFRDRPGPVDRVVVVPTYPGVGAPEGTEVEQETIDAFFAAMQAEGFDLALQMHGGGGNSNPFTLRLGARHTAGLRVPGAPPLDRNVPYIYYQREPLRYLEVAGTVGAEPVEIEPRLTVTDTDLAEADRVLPPGSAPLAVIHPGVGNVDRQWPPEKFAAVADALARAGAEIAVTGTEAERDTVTAVIEHMTSPVHDLAGRLSIGGLVGLLSRAAVVVSNDTGPRHLAEAIGTPTVAIYWCFNMINADPTTRTIHRPLVSWQLDCPICGRSQTSDPCDHGVSYVADVPVEDVTEQALDLLGMVAAGVA